MFEKVAPLAPARAGRITIIISSQLNPDHTVKTPTGSFELEVLDTNDNVVKTMAGNLVPELTNAQAQGIVQLMTDLRAKANAEAV